MMARQSPPKHRHDGTSPLPLGMDWSSPPRKWLGRDTVWPHDPHTGWSYCVTIPSWSVFQNPKDSNPVVFFRVQVGVQSSEGITTTRVVLRRFNDFLKLYNDLQKAFLNKNLPPVPPKGLMRMKSRVMLEERRCSLVEWMTKLLSDIDISRSVAVASFFELEAAARSSFEDVNQQTSEATTPESLIEFHPKSNLSVIAGSSSITSDYGSDTAYETSDLGTPRLGGRDLNFEIGMDDLSMDDDLTGPIEKLVKYGITNTTDEGFFMSGTVLEQSGDSLMHKAHATNGNDSNAALLDRGKMVISSVHARKLSSESIRSDVSSVRGSEISNTGMINSSVDGSGEGYRGMEISCNQDSKFLSDGKIVLPLEQRHKLNRVLVSMDRRLVAAKTDMEDLIARLNQEIAVKDYLSTKVKYLEVELETTKQKAKENLQQTMLVERERFTQMQWDMEELRRTNLELELKLKSRQTIQDEKLNIDSTKVFPLWEKDSLLQELDSTKEQFQKLLKQHDELQTKSRSDIKLLVKEVKSLRYSQTELKQELGKSIKEKSEAERLVQKETQKNEHSKVSRRKLLHECRNLHNRLEDCNVNFLNEDGNKIVMNSSSLSDALDLLTISDNRIGLLVAEAQLLAQEDINNFDSNDLELRNMLSEIFIENAKLRTQVNSVIRYALKIDDNTSDKNGK